MHLSSFKAFRATNLTILNKNLPVCFCCELQEKKRVNEYHLLSANYKRVIVVVQGRWDLFPPLFSSFINIQKCIAGELK